MSGRNILKVVLILLLVVMIDACHRRERVTGNQCRAPAAPPCAACSIRCPIGQASICTPGESDGGTCKTQSSCVCR